MKVFLDVGAHMGETLRAPLSPRFRFDRICCFEPASRCWRRLERGQVPRVEVFRFGLSDQTGRRLLYDAGNIGASVMGRRSGTGAPEMATFVRASEWMAQNVGDGDRVFMKLNCEGSECDILEDLLDSGEIRKVASMLVYFDVSKFPAQRHREAVVKARLEEEGVRTLVEPRDVAGETHVDRIRRWLEDAGATAGTTLEPRERVRDWLDDVRFRVGPRLGRVLRLPRIARLLLPRATYRSLRARLLGYESGSPRTKG